MLRVLRIPISALAVLVLTAASAAAGGHGGGHRGGFKGGGGFRGGGGFHKFHGGVIVRPFNPFFFRPVRPFGPAFLAPPFYYAPVVVVVASPLITIPAPGQCSFFQGNALIAGTSRPFFGTACWQPDGMWHIAP